MTCCDITHKYSQVFPYKMSHHEFIETVLSDWTGLVFPVVAADCLPVSEAGGEPGVLSALIGVHPELENRFILFPSGLS